MRRKTKAIIVGTITGSVMIVGSKFALASSHDVTKPQHVDSESRHKSCASDDEHGKRTALTAKSSREHESEHEGEDSEGRKCPSTPKPTGTQKPAPSPSTASKPPAPAPSPTGATSPKPPAPSATASAAPTCTTTTGAAATTVSPGNGTVTVTIKVCNGAITSATATQVDKSGYSPNTQAIPALNALVVQYYKTDITKIHYSGATLTSNAYQTSLKSAMTLAGI